MKEIKPPYWGKLKGNVGATHHRENLERASEPNPRGDAAEIDQKSWHYLRYQKDQTRKLIA